MKIIKKFQNLKFRNKLMLSYMVVILIPFIGWSLYSYVQTNKYLEAQQKQSVDVVFNNLVNTLEKQTLDIENYMESFTKNSLINDIINNQYSKTYDKYFDLTNKFDPTVDNMLLLNNKINNVVIYTNGSISESRLMFKPFDEIRKRQGYEKIKNTIDIVWYKQDDKLYLAQQTYNWNDAQTSSVVEMEISSEILFSGLDQKDTYDLQITDRYGSVVFSTVDKAHDFSKEPTKKNEVFQKRVLNSSELCVYMRANLDKALVSPYKVFVSLVVIIIISFILLLLMTIFFSKTFVKRIEYLQKRLPKIVNSDFKIAVGSDVTDEIGDITNSVGSMVKDTRRLIDEVYISKLAQKDAEMKALQAQINPHFLYNTLSAINWEAIKTKNDNISKVATALSSFYRTTLNKGSSVTTVAGELNNIQAYIEIQQYTHSNSFDVEYDIDERLLEYNMPNLILQPIVENAIEHGVDVKNDVRGNIKISISAHDNDIVFIIEDNGKGMSYDEVSQILETKVTGYGVRNVDQRIKLFFAENYGLKYESEDTKGTKVTITIPKYVEMQ